MEYSISFPENLFSVSHKKIEELKSSLIKLRMREKLEKEYAKERGVTDSADLEIINRRKREINGQIKAEGRRMDLYWEYMVLRSLDFKKEFFNNKTFSADLSEHLGMSRRDVNKRKRKIISVGWASIKNGKLWWKSKDDVWRDFGVLVEKRKYDRDGRRITHQQKGVYKVIGEKKVKKMKGELNPKTDRPYTKDVIYTFEVKADVKVIKFKVEKHQLNRIDLQRQAALAVFKHKVDRKTSKLTEEELRKINESPSVDISCNYIAKKVGYTSSGSGKNLRHELEDCGFITVLPKRQEVEDKIKYEDAKDKYPLHDGVQTDTGLAYYFCKKTEKVFGVACFGIKVNGYTAINYKANKVQKPKKERKRWIPFNTKMLMQSDGLKVRKIWQQLDFLFEDSRISDYLREVVGMDNIFRFKDWETWNLKLAVAAPLGNN